MQIDSLKFESTLCRLIELKQLFVAFRIEKEKRFIITTAKKEEKTKIKSGISAKVNVDTTPNSHHPTQPISDLKCITKVNKKKNKQNSYTFHRKTYA